MMISNNISDMKVSVYEDKSAVYPGETPYNPSTRHVEYLMTDLSAGENKVYEAVRNSLALLGLDRGNFNTPRWDPLKGIVRPTDTVVIKPNFVLHTHYNGQDPYSIITHPSVIRAVIDYAYIAIKGKGRIIVADSPIMSCNFEELLKTTGLLAIKELYAKKMGFNIEIYDLRNFWVKHKGGESVIYSGNRIRLPGDPLGDVKVNLGQKSLFYDIANSSKFYGADYDRQVTAVHHSGQRQEYSLSKTVLSCDAFISIPKLKVHKKVGVTLNIKGLVGITVNKNYLVHYRVGTPSIGGDEFPDEFLSCKEKLIVKARRFAYDNLLSAKIPIIDRIYILGSKLCKSFGFKIAEYKKRLDSGSWYGNDSAWRMAIDLSKILIYADKDGYIQDNPVRRVFSIVDGIVGGEGEGPLVPSPKKCGIIIAGSNLCAVDLVSARLMGFEHSKLKILDYPLCCKELFQGDINDIRIHSNGNFSLMFSNKEKYLSFKPPQGWVGHVEV